MPSATMFGKPIPALYAVYILRSTVRHASLYIGSTPHPPRRLKQHNGEMKGGANRTSRDKLRPWEMVTLVTGFPSMVSALKFEWALNNPHITTHIPDESRISKSTSRKKCGQPKRPTKRLASILANVHLLLGVPSFARWPLKLCFFAQDVHAMWMNKISPGAETPLRGIEVLTDFKTGEETEEGGTGPSSPSSTSSQTKSPTKSKSQAKGKEAAWGIHALSLDYKPMEDYITKTKEIFEFEREGNCIVCQQRLVPDSGIYAVCPNHDCEGVGHIDCWSSYVLSTSPEEEDGVEEENSHIIPTRGTCPSCKGKVEWGYMMKELSLRLRGQDEVEKLLRKRGRKTKAEKEKEEEMRELSECE